MFQGIRRKNKQQKLHWCCYSVVYLIQGKPLTAIWSWQRGFYGWLHRASAKNKWNSTFSKALLFL